MCIRDSHKRYGFNSPQNLVEIVNYRLKCTVPQNNDLLSGMKYEPIPGQSGSTVQKVLMGGQWRDCHFYTWNGLPVDSRCV